MQKGFIKYYILDLIILLFSIAMFKNMFIYTILWLVTAIVFLIINGFYKETAYIKGTIVRIVIIGLISYFLVIYLAGIFTGFFRNVFNTSLIGIIKNAYKTIIIIVSEEIVRHKIAKKCQYNIKPYIFFTLVLIFLNIGMEFSGSINNTEELFIFICSIVLPTIASEFLYSYLSFYIGPSQNILVRIFTSCYIYVIPILPSLGNYLKSVIGVTYPLVIFLSASKVVKYYKKEKSIFRRAYANYIYAPIICVLLILVSLVSGFFKYQLIAIASGSMEPVIYRGDGVIFKKIDDFDELELGTVVAYVKDNTLITHRIVSIDYNNKTIKTKGDNNPSIDNFIIYEEEIRGIVLYNIKYIGYPTIWFNELR